MADSITDVAPGPVTVPTPAPAPAPAPAPQADQAGQIALNGPLGDKSAPASTGYDSALMPQNPQPAPQPTPAPQPVPQPQPADPELQPISDWSKVDLQLGDAPVDGTLMESFGKAAVSQHLTPAQARALAQAHIQAVREQTEARLATERELLEKAWGKDVQRNTSQVALLCQRLSRVPGCEKFQEALEASGGASSAVVMLGLYQIARVLGEDTRGRFGSSGLAGGETAEEGVRAVFAAARGMA